MKTYPADGPVSIDDFEEIAVLMMGKMVAVPLKKTYGWRVKFNRVLAESGIVGPMDVAELCSHVMTWQTTPISIETLASKASMWLAMARAKAEAPVVKPRATPGPALSPGAPAPMPEDD
jgi:hypothetical protein